MNTRMFPNWDNFEEYCYDHFYECHLVHIRIFNWVNICTYVESICGEYT